MFKYVSLEEQVRNTKKECATLLDNLNKQAANMEYVAMMCDIDIPSEEMEVTVNE